MSRVGRLRIRLSEMLATHGVIIKPEDIDQQWGRVDRNPGNDLARWFGYAMWRKDLQKERGSKCYVYSWDTMGDCVKYGFTVSPASRKEWGEVEVVAIQISKAW